MKKTIKLSIIASMISLTALGANEVVPTSHSGSHLGKLIKEKKESRYALKESEKKSDNYIKTTGEKTMPSMMATEKIKGVYKAPLNVPLTAIDQKSTTTMELPKLTGLVPEKVEKTKDQLKYEKIMKILSKVDEDNPNSLSDTKVKEENNIDKLELIESFILPEPISSIKIQGKLSVFALIQTNKINKNTETTGSALKTFIKNDKKENAIDSSLFKYQELVVGYNTKKIKLYIGQQFNGWKVTKLSKNSVEYTNIQSDEQILKFY